jgi:predicted TIM-barrel fold metal-dependent hydrolase
MSERRYRVISADGHIETPPEYWVKYVPARYKDHAPRLIKLEGGGEAWKVEGVPLMYVGQHMAAGKRMVRVRNESYSTADGRPAPGTGGPVQRLLEQDEDGIDAEVLYAPAFVARGIAAMPDQKAYLAMVQAYNTFLAQEFCAVAPDRLIGVGVIPLSGIEDAVNELKRCHELGLRAVSFEQFPNGSGEPQPEDDHFWEAALTTGIRLAPHNRFGTALVPYGKETVPGSREDFAMHLCQRANISPVYALLQTITAGILDRFPEIRFYVAETNAGWLPEVLYMLDDNYALFKDWYEVELKMTPSEYIREHFLFSIIRDPLALKLRDFLPVENLMWGSDFPHAVTSFPKSREWLQIIFDEVPAGLRRRILLENPAEFFGLDLDRPITATPPV